jgi:hypothetical protein
MSSLYNSLAQKVLRAFLARARDLPECHYSVLSDAVYLAIRTVYYS